MKKEKKINGKLKTEGDSYPSYSNYIGVWPLGCFTGLQGENFNNLCESNCKDTQSASVIWFLYNYNWTTLNRYGRESTVMNFRYILLIFSCLSCQA